MPLEVKHYREKMEECGSPLSHFGDRIYPGKSYHSWQFLIVEKTGTTILLAHWAMTNHINFKFDSPCIRKIKFYGG